jgi:hypothetical protein
MMPNALRLRGVAVAERVWGRGRAQAVEGEVICQDGVCNSQVQSHPGHHFDGGEQGEKRDHAGDGASARTVAVREKYVFIFGSE